uniref:Uncharacterized protein n=1 Tax=Pseudo-nitzschia delicatissima TaxID=44447 RepID=A0A7S0UKX2_9STRA|mmetsp:Transcript_1296/g.2667  ORF Transcript_1296/g.2667 Transcript_1296/m.2667 type:complete len:297 (+) Transcript_1296:287-1177(+)|eukprot:CAMPEP_0197272562 /NCGR_PEP_ID=MMETSP1432-20130617/10063_1 /TAXON_ID=44447 /ORGANISM="Pseudo-nitzschia delicatissima, Strain UNC1205" /LENGTH=296 /DNA_ID=CAMNT_0042738123 /DNA_START=219 /DNA_END=1109 /DNA_ORIENTATION=+
MKIHVSLVVLALLQLGLPSGVAQESQGHLRRGDNKAEETERELRPYGYPVARRPAQGRKYGAPPPYLGFRSYTNSNPVASAAQQGSQQQQFFGAPAAQPGSLFQGPPRQQQFFGGKSTKGSGIVPTNPRGFRPATIPTRADGSVDGTFVAGVPRTGSLGQALGFYKVESGSTIIFVQDENDDAAVVEANAAAAVAAAMETDPPEPTVSPAPTLPVTPSPTAEPTINPTKAPTPVPTSNPTNNPTLPPTKTPTSKPSKRPTRAPTVRPSRNPTSRPTRSPTKKPTASPTTLAAATAF